MDRAVVPPRGPVVPLRGPVVPPRGPAVPPRGPVVPPRGPMVSVLSITVAPHGSSEGHEMLKRNGNYHSIPDDVPIPKM